MGSAKCLIRMDIVEALYSTDSVDHEGRAQVGSEDRARSMERVGDTCSKVPAYALHRIKSVPSMAESDRGQDVGDVGRSACAA